MGRRRRKAGQWTGDHGVQGEGVHGHLVADWKDLSRIISAIGSLTISSYLHFKQGGGFIEGWTGATDAMPSWP